MREQAKDLLRWTNACGTYLSRLVDDESCVIVSEGEYDGHAKRKRYRIKRAPGV